jgi:hypothetical protein
MSNHVHGTKHHSAKLNPAKVRQARKSYEVRLKDGSRKWTIAALARKYGVTRPVMAQAIRGETWAHVK